MVYEDTIDPRSYARNLGDQLPVGLTVQFSFFFLHNSPRLAYAICELYIFF